MEEIHFAKNNFFSYETRKLIETILRASKFELMKTEQAFTQQLGAAAGRRKRRDIGNPLSAIGKVTERAFGLTSREHFDNFKTSVNDNLNLLRKNEAKLSRIVEETSTEIQESLAGMKKFNKFLTNLNTTHQDLIKTDKMFMRLLTHKVELDTCLNNVRRALTVVTEIVDQANLGLGSRFMFSYKSLTSSVARITESPGLSPVFQAENVQKYFEFPLTLTHLGSENIQSLIRIPLVEQDDAVFLIRQQFLHWGLIVAENSKQRVILTFSQHRQCLKTRKGKNKGAICLLRPCYLQKDENLLVKCIHLDDTNFIISSSLEEPILITSTCSGSNKVLEISNFTKVEVPKHCQLNSHYFSIKPIQTTKENSSHNSAFSTDVDVNQHKELRYLCRYPDDDDGLYSAPPAPSLRHTVLAVTGSCLAVLSLLALACLSPAIWRKMRRREQRQDTVIRDKVQRETGTGGDDPLFDFPPPYNSDSVEISEDILTNGRILFSGVLELICEEQNDDGTIVVQNCSQCSSVISGTMLKMIEQNFKESLNIPSNCHLYLSHGQQPSTSYRVDVREKSTLIEFSTK